MDNGSFVTERIEQVRKRAAERQLKKCGVTRGDAGKQNNKSKTTSGNSSSWIHSLPDGSPLADHAPGSLQKKRVLVEQGASFPEILERRGWAVYTKWNSWSKDGLAAGEAKKFAERVVVLREFTSDTLGSSSPALLCRVFGGFLTTQIQVEKSLKSTDIASSGRLLHGDRERG